MSNTSATIAPRSMQPDCDRCTGEMQPSGWMPRPNGHGGLIRLTVFRCGSCGRLFDELWGHRDATGDL